MTQTPQRIIAQRSDWANAFTGSGALRIRYPRGELICQIGSYAAGVYLVTTGIVRESLSRGAEARSSGAFEILGPGDLIGLEVLFGREEALHVACSRAITGVELAFLTRDAFADAVDQDLDLRWRLLRHMAVRHLSVRRAMIWGHSSAEERLCRLLLDLGRKLGGVDNGEDVHLPAELDWRTLTEILGISAGQARRACASLPSLSEKDGRIHFSGEALADHLSALARGRD